MDDNRCMAKLTLARFGVVGRTDGAVPARKGVDQTGRVSASALHPMHTDYQDTFWRAILNPRAKFQ